MANQTFSVTIQGLASLQRVFKQSPQIVTPIYKEAINKSGAVLDNTRLNPSNIPWITGELARRWSTSYGDLFLRTQPNVDYARAVQFGMPASPGRYVPAIKRRLKNGANIGIWPGFKGRHYMEKITSIAAPTISEIFREALQQAVQAIKNA